MDHKIGSGARCAMIGYGSWATALAKVLTENEPSIGWYVRNPEVLESLRDKGRNPRYLSNVRFDRTRINPRTISTGWFPRPTSSSWPAPRPT